MLTISPSVSGLSPIRSREKAGRDVVRRGRAGRAALVQQALDEALELQRHGGGGGPVAGQRRLLVAARPSPQRLVQRPPASP